MKRFTMKPMASAAFQWRRLGKCGILSSALHLRNDSPLHCGVPHYMSRVSYVTQTIVLHQSWSQRGIRQWMCVKQECRTVNTSTATNCEACGAEKPALKGWLCEECQTRNHKGVKKCRKCHAPSEASSEFWMCIACEKNNRIDDLDDNSRCGFCGYDMAPMSMTEMEAMRISNERSERLREVQQQFDSISAQEADDQLGDETAGASSLPRDIREPSPIAAANPTNPSFPKIPDIKPFTPAPMATSHSRLMRKPRPSLPTGTPTGPPGFDWICRESTCGTINPGDEEKCTNCGTHIAPAEWECLHCGASNHLSRSRCFNCRISIPVSWICTGCSTATSIYDRDCRQCGAARPPTEPKEAREVRAAADASSATNARRGGAPRRHDWYCSECQGLNFASRTACFQCGVTRRGGAGGDTSRNASWGQSENDASDAVVGHNNWFCRHCQASNFRTRTSCWQCGHDSAESGATSWSEDESAPHFEKEGFQSGEGVEDVADGKVSVWGQKSDDWTCGKCFSKNFKNRQECHKCGSKKTVAVAPRRAFVRKPVKI